MSYDTPPGTAGGYGGGYSTPPPNHLVWAILATILCCVPAGIVSIVYAAQVNSKWQAGDHEGALSSSNNARTWAIVAAVGGLIAALIVFGAQSGSGSSY